MTIFFSLLSRKWLCFRLSRCSSGRLSGRRAMLEAAHPGWLQTASCKYSEERRNEHWFIRLRTRHRRTNKQPHRTACKHPTGWNSVTQNHSSNNTFRQTHSVKRNGVNTQSVNRPKNQSRTGTSFTTLNLARSPGTRADCNSARPSVDICCWSDAQGLSVLYHARTVVENL